IVGTSMSESAAATAVSAATDDDVEVESAGFSGLAVQAVGYGISGDKDESVIVYVSRGSKAHLKRLASKVDSVEVLNAGRVVVYPESASGSTNRANLFLRRNRIACGSSCAPAGENYSGTFGAIVSRGEDLFALSNNHVFAAGNHTPVGQPILSPSGSDARPNLPAPTEICRQSEIIELRSGSPALVPLVSSDTAIAQIVDDTKVSSWQGDRSDGYDTPSDTEDPVPGMKVKKFGRTTGLTYGVVEAIIPTPFPLPYKCEKFSALVFLADIISIRVVDGESFALPGDSGSLVVTDDGNFSVGLLFATNKRGDIAYIANINTVLSSLQLELVDDHGV
ncbi:hypothetical protein N9L06_05290, partial [Mariniblastus sp.]|nr:hypothetical protein [Mariniblastus sp.]